MPRSISSRACPLPSVKQPLVSPTFRLAVLCASTGKVATVRGYLV